MTDVTNRGSLKSASGERTGQLVLIILGIIALAAAAYFLSRPTDIDRSIVGLKGFAQAAKAQANLDIRFFEGKEQLDPKKIGLRILPLYDPNLLARGKPQDRDLDNDQARILREISQSVFRRKVNSITTLVILPKWRAGALRLEQLHPDLLIDTSSFKLPYRRSGGVGEPEVRRQGAGFQQSRLTFEKPVEQGQMSVDHSLALYAAQTLSDDLIGNRNCLPSARFKNDIILAHCAWDVSGETRKTQFWLLTDPDVLNNHGAKNGDNFRFGADLVRSLAGGKPIIVDGTNRVYLKRAGGRDSRERSFSDLARFFEYPFSLFWSALAGLCFFGLWHAWRREGPILEGEEDKEIEASKKTAIEASVTILRGTHGSQSRDLALAQQHVAQRMRTFCSDILGNQASQNPNAEEQALAVLTTRNAALAKKLNNASKQFSISAIPAQSGTLFDRLNHFEKTLNEARHEFGRPAKALR